MVEEQQRNRKDIFGWPVFGFIFKNPRFIAGLRLAVFVLFSLAIYFGLVYPDQNDNPFTTAVFWSLFWPFFMIVSIALMGPAFCGICPHNFIGRHLTRRGLKKPLPGWLKNPYISLVVLLLAYWFILYTFPSVHSSPLYAALLFLVLTVVAFVMYFLFKDMEYCKNVCPIGPLTKAFGKVGTTWLSTYPESCKECKSFECAKACDAHLQPFKFDKNNSMGDCTLCMDCAQACEAVRFEVRKPSYSLWSAIKKMSMTHIWVFVLVTAAATITMRFHHGLSRTAIADSFPWSRSGAWLESVFGYAGTVDWVGLSAFVMALVISMVLVFGGMWIAAKIMKSEYRKTLLILGYGLAPLMIIGAMNHVLSFFFYHYASDLGTAWLWLTGSGGEMAPLANWGDTWVKVFGIFPYVAAIWSFWLIAARMKQIDAARAKKWLAYPFAAALPLFYTFLILFSIYAFATYGAKKSGHSHGGHGGHGGGELFQSVSTSQAVLLQEGEHKASCPNCGMKLPMFYKTNHAVTFKNGVSRQFCSIHCLADALENGPIKADKDLIESIRVVDAKGLSFIDVEHAIYVVGSRQRGTMSMVSKYAFASKEDAHVFIEKHGGRKMTFEGAYKEALKDFAAH